MKAIIIDDEPAHRETLRVYLSGYCPQIELKGEASNGWDGLKLYKQTKPDIIFLDIELPDLSGFEVLERIGPTKTAVIFVTAYNKYAEMAFEFSALDFLRKPIEPTRLVKAVYRASEMNRLTNVQSQYQMLLELINQQHGASDQRDMRIAFNTQTEIVYSWLKNILYISSEGNMSYIKLVENPKRLLIAKNIGAFEKQFIEAEASFLLRVHRSYLVNLYHIKRFIRDDSVLMMSDGERIPLAEGKREEVLKWINH